MARKQSRGKLGAVGKCCRAGNVQGVRPAGWLSACSVWKTACNALRGCRASGALAGCTAMDRHVPAHWPLSWQIQCRHVGAWPAARADGCGRGAAWRAGMAGRGREGRLSLRLGRRPWAASHLRRQPAQRAWAQATPEDACPRLLPAWAGSLRTCMSLTKMVTRLAWMAHSCGPGGARGAAHGEQRALATNGVCVKGGLSGGGGARALWPPTI